MKVRTLLGSALIGIFAASANASIVINEIRVDQPGADNDEYFELFGTPFESLAGLSYVVIGDTQGLGGAIESITPLSGFIPLDGFYLAVESTYTLTPPPVGGTPDLVTSMNFENSDNVTHLLVSGINPALNTGDGFGNGTASDVDLDDDGVIDATGDWDGDTIDDGAPWASILDIIALVETPGLEDLIYGPNSVGPDGTFQPGHVGRVPDGGDWAIGGFTPALGFMPDDSPGTTNVPEPGTIALLGIGCMLLLRRRS